MSDELWPHQVKGLDEMDAAVLRGERKVCVSSPTGGGKTRMIDKRVELAREHGKKLVLYTNRKLLLEQTSKVLALAGHSHGVRAAGYDDEREFNIQVSSIQTEHSRVMRNKKWSNLHDAEEVHIDECHIQKGEQARAIMDAHIEAGAVIFGWTATPIELKDLYDTLIIAGTNSELRRCGALLPSWQYGPDEPDLKKVRRVSLGDDLSENQVRDLMGKVEKDGVPNVKLQALAGRILDWRVRINPEGHAEIVFWPGVKESMWGCQQFEAAGIKSAHIDGENVWVDGELHRTSPTVRQQVLDDSRKGIIKSLHNRFVLREGIDCPWLVHCIFATVFGSLQSYLQSGGRILRAYPGLDHVTVQDHGGNWWRHGSLNEDRVWKLDQTNTMLAGVRKDGFLTNPNTQPIRCPRCSKILHGWKCPCGYEITKNLRMRPVIQEDGTLKEYTSDIFKRKHVKREADTFDKWKECYWRCRNSGRTFSQAEGLFVQENHYWPPRNLPMMPVDPEDWYRKVVKVPKEKLQHAVQPAGVPVVSGSDTGGGEGEVRPGSGVGPAAGSGQGEAMQSLFAEGS